MLRHWRGAIAMTIYTVITLWDVHGDVIETLNVDKPLLALVNKPLDTIVEENLSPYSYILPEALFTWSMDEREWDDEIPF